MVLVRVQHIYKHKSGLPKDDVVNSFHFQTVTPLTNTSAQALIDSVSLFYNGTANPAGAAVNLYIASQTMITQRELYKVYDLDTPAPRIPFTVQAQQGGAANNSIQSLPSEVAVCLSYAGTPTAGLSQKHRRGRVFIGPLNVNSLSAVDNFSARPTSGFLDGLRQGGKRMQDAAAIAGFQWVVYSPGLYNPTPTSPGVYPGLTIVDQVSTDDSFDTQRSRGVAPTARTMMLV